MKQNMNTKTLLLVFSFCLLFVVAVNISTLFSGRGFQSQTTLRSGKILCEETFYRSIRENNRDIIIFLKWKSKFHNLLEYADPLSKM